VGKIKIVFLLSLIPFVLQAGWDPYRAKKTDFIGVKDYKINRTIRLFLKKQPRLKLFFQKAYGYVVFPMIGKGGMGFGVAYGEGKVYRKNSLIGKSTLTQVSVGFQLGGQGYSEIIFFKDKKALDRLKKGDFTLSAQASAVVVKTGISVDIDYSDGVAVFTLPKVGLMYEASVGGQKFSFTPYY